MSRALRLRALIVTFALLGLVTTGAMCSRVTKRGRYVSAYSTLSAGPGGARGVFELSKRLGYPTSRWSEDLARLPDAGVLIALGGCESAQRRSLTTAEEENLQAFLEGGGILIVAGADHYLDVEQGVVLDRDADACPPSAVERALSGTGTDRGDSSPAPGAPRRPDDDAIPAAFRTDTVSALMEEEQGLPSAKNAIATHTIVEGVGEIGMRQPALILVDQARDHDVLMTLSGERAAVRMPVGDGAIVALSSASMFQNRDLAERGGAILFARLIERLGGEGPVMFDEYHLGLGAQRSLVRYLRELGLAALLVQLLIVLGFVFLRHGRSFGAPLRSAPPAPRGVASYVRSIGKMYARSEDRSAALEVLTTEALHDIARQHRVDGPLESLASALRRDGETSAAERVEALHALSRNEIARDRELLAAAREATRPRDDLPHHGTGNAPVPPNTQEEIA